MQLIYFIPGHPSRTQLSAEDLAQSGLGHLLPLDCLPKCFPLQISQDDDGMGVAFSTDPDHPIYERYGAGEWHPGNNRRFQVSVMDGNIPTPAELIRPSIIDGPRVVLGGQQWTLPHCWGLFRDSGPIVLISGGRRLEPQTRPADDRYRDFCDQIEQTMRSLTDGMTAKITSVDMVRLLTLALSINYRVSAAEILGPLSLLSTSDVDQASMRLLEIEPNSADLPPTRSRERIRFDLWQAGRLNDYLPGAAAFRWLLH